MTAVQTPTAPLRHPMPDAPTTPIPSTPGEGTVYFQIALAAAAAGLRDVERHALQAAVKDHAESCVVAERKRILTDVLVFGREHVAGTDSNVEAMAIDAFLDIVWAQWVLIGEGTATDV